MQEFGEIGLASITKNFEVGGRYSEAGSWRGGDKKWKPLSIVTLLGGEAFGEKGKGKFRKKKDGSLTKRGQKRLDGKKILIGQGNLLNSISSKADIDSVQWGTNMIYAAIHNFGGKAGRGKKVDIPARPYLVLQDQDLDEMTAVLDDYLTGDFQ
ncbi:MAG: phage virion morphogenesis protein [Candidatus Nitronauta litoralis]|uniref:Phage virion morphogenesis protein n=1 Tax=Candidatus Nitronauta litoralis TaxID=2705533 RepID=A0A7T0G1R1_9BACT|nr:MAG: phage virion morphogenesis protein [Candidatus Nitronauta litoralis]QPJ63739.1 MAG: phage virion morphogenesis protein [Candidatus Nitronauta litoralis]